MSFLVDDMGEGWDIVKVPDEVVKSSESSGHPEAQKGALSQVVDSKRKNVPGDGASEKYKRARAVANRNIPSGEPKTSEVLSDAERLVQRARGDLTSMEAELERLREVNASHEKLKEENASLKFDLEETQKRAKDLLDSEVEVRKNLEAENASLRREIELLASQAEFGDLLVRKVIRTRKFGKFIAKFSQSARLIGRNEAAVEIQKKFPELNLEALPGYDPDTKSKAAILCVQAMNSYEGNLPLLEYIASRSPMTLEELMECNVDENPEFNEATAAGEAGKQASAGEKAPGGTSTGEGAGNAGAKLCTSG